MNQTNLMKNLNYLIKNLAKEVCYDTSHKLDVTTDDDFSALNDSEVDGTDVAQHLDSDNIIRTASYLNVLMNYANDDMTRVQFCNSDPIYDENLDMYDLLKIMKGLGKLGASGIIKRAQHNQDVINRIHHLEKSMQPRI